MKNFDLDSFFILYSNCISVKGAIRSIICDLQMQKFYYIPNDLHEILQTTKKQSLRQLYEIYGVENSEVLKEYFCFLIENNLGFFDTDPQAFPDMSLEWDSPSTVTNSIIDIDHSSLLSINYQKIIQELSSLNCKCVQIRSFTEISYDALEKLVSYTLDTRINEIRLVLKYDKHIKENLDELLIKNKRISEIILFAAPNNSIENLMGVNFIFLETEDINDKDCGNICVGSFASNISHFTEAINFNSCLNRKISVDIGGYIKNCPSQKDNFGNITETSLSEALKNQNFLQMWKIKKDDISTCKDCEYRYICTDCRIFINDEADLFSKPSKCTYDPYTANWN